YMTILALLPILLVLAPSNDVQAQELTVDSNGNLGQIENAEDAYSKNAPIIIGGVKSQISESTDTIAIITISNVSIEFTEINTSDILDKIKNGEDIYLKNARIIGELNVSKIELKTVHEEWRMWQKPFVEELKVVESNITIVDSIFENDVDFSNTLFRKALLFWNTSFLGSSNFRTTKFIEDADFGSASFSGGVDFGFAKFSSFAIFSGANFNGVTNFNDARFNSAADFIGASFGGGADFPFAIFDEVAYFHGARFDNAAVFDYATFGEDSYFNKAKFGGAAHFNDINFNDVYFTDTEFFSVSLVNTDFQSVRVEWSSLKNALVFDGPTYLKLIKNFKDMEQFGDADDAYYQYRLLSQKNKNGFSWLSDEIWRITCGYGVKPGNTILFGVLIILIFSLIYCLGGDVSIGDAFYFSMTTFASAQSKDWYPVDRYRKIAHIIERLSGWFILSLFIVTLAKVMIRP
ncbi:MAG: pentapeptide repeat-containing protein, partial [Euryarchaeota archaeon]|nr:pentapeptide repeat-containing protein [Euryarchaeota archaeon]